MIHIRPIDQCQAEAAKRIILSVVEGVFDWQIPLEEIACLYEQNGELRDLADIQGYYLDHRGLFLVAMDGESVIGTEGVSDWEGETCEIKRLWLLEPYQGKGIGYQITQQLLAHARVQDFRSVRLTTSPQQTRAIRFYEQIGFKRAGLPSGEADEILYDMIL